MCVCVCVCVCSVFLCVFMWTHSHTHAHKYPTEERLISTYNTYCMWAYVRLVYVYPLVYMYVRIPVGIICAVPLCIPEHVHMSTTGSVYTAHPAGGPPTCVQTCTYVAVYVHVFMYVHTYIYCICNVCNVCTCSYNLYGKYGIEGKVCAP